MIIYNKPFYSAYVVGGSFGNQTVVDKVPIEMLHMIDKYWYQYAPLNPLWHGILGFIMIVIGSVSLLGNGVVIYIFTTTKSLRTPSNLLVVNLAFSDFMMMAAMSPAMVINCYYETWILGPLMCEIYGMCGSLFGCTSIWTMTMIAFDRYNVIVKGITSEPMTHTGARLRIFFVWLASLIWTLLPLFGWNRYVPEGNMTACGTDYLTKDMISRSYILIYSVWVYYTPLILIVYSYYFIVKAVASHEKNMRDQAKRMNVVSLRNEEEKNTRIEIRLAKIALMTISLWFIAWTPYLIINYAGIFEASHFTPLATIWGSVFAKFNAAYNPIVYGISHPKYREALFKKLPILLCSGDDTEKDDGISMKTGVTHVSNTK